MSGATQPSPSDESWPGTTAKVEKPTLPKTPFRAPLFSINEAPDFYNPFSELNLFLSQKVKQEVQANGSIQKWSHKIQEDLIKNITPDFQKKFPRYRLGVSALKKMWEKISWYLHHIEGQKEAVTQEGKLNIPFFIKENLKSFSPYKMAEPHLFASGLARKISECAATIDGVKPKFDPLVRMIWALQRHLLSGSSKELQSPYDTYDQQDKQVVRVMLEITAKEPCIPYKDLQQKVKETLPQIDEEKIQLWTMQGDLVYRWIQLDQEDPLYKLLREKTAEELLTTHPELDPVRIQIFSKYLWYKATDESSLIRFVKWHVRHTPKEKLQELCDTMIPYLPVNLNRIFVVT